MPNIGVPPAVKVGSTFYCPIRGCIWKSDCRTSYARHHNGTHRKSFSLVCNDCGAGHHRADHYRAHIATCGKSRVENMKKRGRKPAWTGVLEDELEEMRERVRQLEAENSQLRDRVRVLEQNQLEEEEEEFEDEADDFELVLSSSPAAVNMEVDVLPPLQLEVENQETLVETVAVLPPRRSSRKTSSAVDREDQDLMNRKFYDDNDHDLGLEVANIPGKGRGVLARKEIAAGRFVVEYAGEHHRMDTAPAMEAAHNNNPAAGSYTMYFKHGGEWHMVDATRPSERYGRLLNHSRRRPNCKAKVVMMGQTPRLVLASIRDITYGEELTWTYGGDMSAASLLANPWLANN